MNTMALKKLLAKVGRIVSARKVWRLPRKSPLLIYSGTGEQYLREYVGPWNPEVLHVDAEFINIPILLASLFQRGDKRARAYRDCYIRRVEPRLIVTYVDNTIEFYSVSSRHPGIKTLFIQNGIRAATGDVFEHLAKPGATAESFEVDYMLTLGRATGEAYSRYIKGIVLPIGSLRNNMTKRASSKTPGTIGFNSQFRNARSLQIGGKCFSFEAFWYRTDRLILDFLKDYSLQNNKKLFIIPCSGHYTDETLELEKSYYRSILGESCVFSEYSGISSSYEATDRTEVVVSIDSTLGYESAVRGNKTAILSIRGRLLGVQGYDFGWPRLYPDEGPFWTNIPDPRIFKRILDHLFSIDEGQWLSEIDLHGMYDLMAFNPGNSKFKSLLQQELNLVE